MKMNSHELEGLVRRAEAMFDSKFPNVDRNVRVVLGQEYTTKEEGFEVWYDARIIVFLVGNKWLPDMFGSLLGVCQTQDKAIELAFKDFLNVLNYQKTVYAEQQDQYFESIGQEE